MSWGNQYCNILEKFVSSGKEGNTLTRYEHFFGKAPWYATRLHEFDEAGTVKTWKDEKLGDHGIPMIFVGVALNLSKDC